MTRWKKRALRRLSLGKGSLVMLVFFFLFLFFLTFVFVKFWSLFAAISTPCPVVGQDPTRKTNAPEGSAGAGTKERVWPGVRDATKELRPRVAAVGRRWQPLATERG